MRDQADQALRQQPEPAERPTADLPTDGENGRPAANFDPTPYLRQLRGRGGGQDYLDVKWRLLWLRREHPDAAIITEHVQLESTIAIFKATVTLPTGGSATGYGSETASDFGDFIEKAETKAIGRALNALGYGAQFGERTDDESEAPAPSAPPRSLAPPAPTRGAAPARPPAAPAPPPERPTPVAGQEASSPSPPVKLPASREREPTPVPPATRSATEPETGAATATAAPPAPADAAAAGEPDLADYSWSAFWPWARNLGLNGPKPVEALIGRPTAGLTPAELRDLILAARGER